MTNSKWLLPDGVEEFLPPMAWELERVRRKILDVFQSWGFSYIEPPIIEYLDALLAGTGDLGHENDLDMQTIKVVDQRSGRLMGIRSDITAQAVRIDAHSLADSKDNVRRLCYAGPVVQANPMAVLDTRVPIKAGAEIFGWANHAADAEVIALLVDVLKNVDIADPVIVLGHMGIYAGLIEEFNLDPETEKALFVAVQAKSQADIQLLLTGRGDIELIQRFPLIMGEISDLSNAVEVLSGASKSTRMAIEELQNLSREVSDRFPDLKIRFDLAELAGYGYHNGPVFSAYQPQHGRAIARGGRYDGIGSIFGEERPATGFDISLQQLITATEPELAVWVARSEQMSGSDLRSLEAEIIRLRSAGERVVVSLGSEDAPPSNCDRELVNTSGEYNVVPLAKSNT